MKKRWIFLQPNPQNVATLTQELHISECVATLLVNRGISEKYEAHRFIAGELKDIPSPFLMKDMKKAVHRLIRAIHHRESIFIYGDYDVDGVTATSCLVNFFSELGVRVGYHIPHRLKEGYGLHVKALEEIKEKGGQVVITADCGISNAKEAEAASQLGIDLIITDHHIIPPELPEAHAVLNPLRKGSDYPDLYLSGVGVVFQLLLALRFQLREEGFFEGRSEPNLKNYLDLVALGTIADLVPLKGVNHILVKEGLKVLTEKKRIGIRALCEVANIRKEAIGTYEVGFQLAPRLNAGGRISSADTGVKLLTTSDYMAALEGAKILQEENEKRRFLQQEVLNQACQKVEVHRYHEHSAIVLSSPHWHAGVIGIVASKLVEKYYRPTFMISEGAAAGKGSARSIEAIHLLEALRECGELFDHFGGHKAAAGFTVPNERIPQLREMLNQIIQRKLTPDDLIPKIKIDMRIHFDNVDKNFLTDISQLAPFGMGNPEPVFSAENFKIKSSSVVGEKHLRMWLEGDQSQVSAIGFQMALWKPEVAKIRSIAYVPEVNEWKGEKSLQLRLKDLKFE